MRFFVPVNLAVVSLLISQIRADEVVVFYPTYAHLDQREENWTAAIHGVIYEPERESIKRYLLVAGIRRALGVEGDTAESATFDRRVRLFLVDNERGKDVSVRLGSEEYRLEESEANGHISGQVRLGVAQVASLLGGRKEANSAGRGEWISFEAVTGKGDQRRFGGRVQLIGPSGLSVISDIDDTIKDTQVGDRKAMLANTFLRDFRPVAGMAELYAQWARQGAVFHYVSGSPWQLFLPLDEFLRERGFPAGSMHMKLFRLTDSTALSLLLSQEGTKLRAIEPILEAFPRRRFVLVGDSAEEDPEIYGQLARKYGRQIAAILIRNVTGEIADGQRLQRAFDGIERRQWWLFGQPEDLPRSLEELGIPEKAAD